ncbi:MAG: hypothetical protein WAV89_15220 [Ignavibacteriaceae bacterium]
MNSEKKFKHSALIALGLVAGIIIAAVDNLVFGGEVSPVVIVVMLIIFNAVFGFIWEWKSWSASLSAWICIPLVHLIKHLLGLPDTLHPNTYASIIMLTVFTFIVSILGSGGGILVHKFLKEGS